MTLFNEPTTGKEFLDGTTRRVRSLERRGAAPAPFFRMARAASFTWPAAAAPVPWDTTIEGTSSTLGYDFASRSFICQMAGTWDLDAQLGAAVTTTANKARLHLFWQKNGVNLNGGIAVTDTSYPSTAFTRVTTELDQGDVLTINYAADSASGAAQPAGSLIDGGSRILCYITGRYVGPPSGTIS